jgi:hypothetical protein
MWTERIGGTVASLEYTFDRAAQAVDFVGVGAFMAAPAPSQIGPDFIHKPGYFDGS